MSRQVKKYTKKLRGREVIEVDTQIARWRKKLKKLGLTTGRHQDRSRRFERERTRKNREKVAIEQGKINFFGVDEE